MRGGREWEVGPKKWWEVGSGFSKIGGRWDWWVVSKMAQRWEVNSSMNMHRHFGGDILSIP